MVDDDDLPQKLLRDCGRVVRGANDRASPEVGLRHASEVEADVVAGHCLLHLRVMSLDGLHFCGDTLGHYHNRVADFHLPRLDPPDGHRPNPCDRLDVLTWNPKSL